MMRTAVRYFSKTGETKIIAEEFAKALKTKAETIEVALGEADILFLGVDASWNGIPKQVKEYIKTLKPEKIRRVVVFSTAGFLGSAYGSMKSKLSAQGITVDEKEFHCKSKDAATKTCRRAAAEFAKQFK